MVGKPFKKGQSGNPGGRPKGLDDVKEVAREYTSKALSVLVEIACSKRSPAAARVSAATAILDRGWGKPAQTISGDPKNPIPLGLTVTFIRPASDNSPS